MREEANRPAMGANGARRVVVAGPLFLDVVLGPMDALPSPGEELWVPQCVFVPGGSANQAVAAARLGLDVELCAYLGQDAPGQMVEKLLAEEGIGSAAMSRIEQQSVTASLSVGSDRAMVTCGTDRAPDFTTGEMPDAVIADVWALAQCRDGVQRWRAQADRPLIVTDVGWDPSEQWDPAILDELQFADYFVPNDGEALRYTRTTDVKEAARILSKSVPNVVITRGDQGVYATDGTQQIDLPAFPVTAVDPTGAGDTFSAALTWAALRGASLREVVSCAAVAAAWSVQRLGGSLSAPTIAELGQWVHQQTIPPGYALGPLELLQEPQK